MKYIIRKLYKVKLSIVFFKHVVMSITTTPTTAFFLQNTLNNKKLKDFLQNFNFCFFR